MAVYAAPKGFKPPEFGAYRDKYGDYAEGVRKYHKACKEYIESLQQWAKDEGSGCQEAGALISFPVHDGHALYVVVSLRPVRLIHVDTDDGYQFPYAHRLTASDIKKEVKRSKY